MLYVSLTFLVFKAIWRAFSALISKWTVTRKRLAVEQNGLKQLGALVIVFTVISRSLSALCAKLPVTSKQQAAGQQIEIWNSVVVV